MSNKKSEQLGMSHGAAANRLRKKILFALIREAGVDDCFRCGKLIEGIDDLSIEHKTPWLDSKDPVGLYFDLDNIAFSHLSCNCGSARNIKIRKPVPPHGTYARYRHGRLPCKCDKCKEANRKYSVEWDKKTGRISHTKVS